MAVKNVIRALAGTAGVMLVVGAAGPGVAAVTMADTGDVQATVRKTVLQTASASGEIITSRMYTQVTAVGEGTKTVVVPVGTTSNRNLNQFGPFPMEGESIQFDLSVDGGTEERTLTDAEINPMEVSVNVLLDGVEIQPDDVVGASGVLDVQYTVRNTTAAMEPVTFEDVEGTEIAEEIETADPFVGSLDVTLPKGFNEVSAPGATIAGNGTNGTQLGYSFVLFPPLGATEVTVGYQARVGDGVMPPADFAFLPVVPFDNSTIASTADAYRGGAEVGTTIFGAGTEIGENLLALQAGAGKLVAGLGQLSAGAEQISDGLVNTAAPGSAALAAGAADLSNGLGELNSQVPALEDGVTQLDDGAQRLNAGAGDLSAGLDQLDSQVPALADGAEQLDDGARSLSAGLDQVQAQVPALADGVSQLDSGAQQVADGMVQLTEGLGLLADTNTGVPAAAAGAEALAAGAADLSTGLGQLVAGLTGASAGATDLAAGLPTAKGGVDQVQDGLDDAVSTGIPQLQGGVNNAAATAACTGDPVCAGNLAAVSDGLSTLLTETTQAAAGLGQVSDGLADAIDGANQLAGGLSTQLLPGAQQLEAGVDTELVPGLNQLVGGLTQASAGITQAFGASQQLTAGAQQVAAGTGQLDEQVPALAAGINQLAAGGTELAAGTSALNAQVPTLAAGVNQLAAGGEELADGTGTLADGTTELGAKVPTLATGVQQLDDGGELVADGSEQLADGLGAAADGSEELAAGLVQAEPGGVQIEEGAGRLKEEGADVLAETGKQAQIGYAKDVAMLESAQAAGLEGAGIPFGPATGTDVVTTAAVQMQLAGMAPDTDNNALKFGLGALLIAGAGGAAYAASKKVAA